MRVTLSHVNVNKRLAPDEELFPVELLDDVSPQGVTAALIAIAAVCADPSAAGAAAGVANYAMRGFSSLLPLALYAQPLGVVAMDAFYYASATSECQRFAEALGTGETPASKMERATRLKRCVEFVLEHAHKRAAADGILETAAKVQIQ